jgi:hypothetical protein
MPRLVRGFVFAAPHTPPVFSIQQLFVGAR